MSNAAQLEMQSKLQLNALAKSLGITGYAGLRKPELVKALEIELSKKTAKPKSGKQLASKLPTDRAEKLHPTSGKKNPTVNSGTAVKAKKSTEKQGLAVARVTPPVSSKSTPKAKSQVPAKAAKSLARTDHESKLNQSSKADIGAKPTSALKRVVSPVTIPEPETPKTNPKVLKKIREMQSTRENNQDITSRRRMVKPPGATEAIWEKEPQRDRIALFVRDAYWLHASWDITRVAVERVKRSLAEQWYTAKPVVRLLRVDDAATSSAAEVVERDIDIHGDLRNWYIPWTGVSTSFRCMIGYLAANKRFYAIAESNTVTTPQAGSNEAVDQHWSTSATDSERIFALSGGYEEGKETGELRDLLEQRMHKNLGAPTLAKIGAGMDASLRRRGDFHFEMDAELVVYGSTVADSYLTLNGEPVSLRPDGTFAVRLPLPDKRQVLPAVCCSRDGSQQRTIVIAVERNTKIMEPLDEDTETEE